VVAAVVVAACSSKEPQQGSPIDSGAFDGPYHPDAACVVTIDSPPDQGASHVPVGTAVTYDSNPPSSGPHFPIWAAYQEFTTPVPRPMLVHNLEHGAIVLLYKCPHGGAPTGGGPADCPDIVQGLRAAAAAIPDDPLCAGTGVRVRTVIAPDPLIDGPVAAAAWDWTYNAACLDVSTLTQFARDRYGQGREPICDNGTTQF
jgi:hypothetical protein